MGGCGFMVDRPVINSRESTGRRGFVGQGTGERCTYVWTQYACTVVTVVKWSVCCTAALVSSTLLLCFRTIKHE